MNRETGLFATIEDLVRLVQSLTTEVISARVRTRALLELLEEKGILGPGEFDGRAAVIWERDYDELAGELLSRPGTRNEYVTGGSDRDSIP